MDNNFTDVFILELIDIFLIFNLFLPKKFIKNLNNIFQGTVNGKLCRKLAKLSKNLILQIKGLIVTFLEIQKFCSCKLVACTYCIRLIFPFFS